MLTELLALKLGATPNSEKAHEAVSQWLQGEIDRDPGAVLYGGASKRDQWQASIE